jgi:hypothetical protein
MQIFRPDDLAENVPYDVLVSNAVQNIGLPVFDDTQKFGSAGRLKSVIYHSFGSVDIFDHEIAHSWGASLGVSLGLLHENYAGVTQGHWNEMADIQGQLGAYYFDPNGLVGHFADNGDGSWRLIPNSEVEPYSALELYMMGLIPPEEVPPIHILESPDLSNSEHISAASFTTITIDEILQAAGGERIPSVEDSQKEFSLAFIVTQDVAYNDASYAYFSIMSHTLMGQNAPSRYSYLAPFYWATGGRATLDTRLPVDVAEPLVWQPATQTPEPTPTEPATATEPPTVTPEPMVTLEPSQIMPSSEVALLVTSTTEGDELQSVNAPESAAEKTDLPLCGGFFGFLSITLIASMKIFLRRMGMI